MLMLLYYYDYYYYYYYYCEFGAWLIVNCAFVLFSLLRNIYLILS